VGKVRGKEGRMEMRMKRRKDANKGSNVPLGEMNIQKKAARK
jgi:hypothetical protein